METQLVLFSRYLKLVQIDCIQSLWTQRSVESMRWIAWVGSTRWIGCAVSSALKSLLLITDKDEGWPLHAEGGAVREALGCDRALLRQRLGKLENK